MKITTQNLSKRFNREWIFRNLNHTFSSGNTYAITGPNGSGKSTLLQVLWGQMPQSAGNVEYLSETNEVVEIENVFKNVSISTPYMDLIEEFTLTEQLQFHFKLRKSRASLSIEEMIRRMYLENARDKYISNFSSGMRQRVKLALAFFTQAEIIFLDEPGTNLDKQAFDWYINELHSLPAQSLVFIASNQPDEYPESAHKINILDYK
ncbi:MAG TPA: ATP-binding cassette domain-containing protein [Cyclobacteriaceae bacterium]|nr:ATP-binding cassette domain-containing protein [Cyclobacteriaceae bacterium]